MTDYSHTIAIARDLLATGRCSQAAELLASVHVPDTIAGSDEDALLRAVEARAILMDGRDGKRALGRIDPYRSVASRRPLKNKVRSEVSVWLAWALISRSEFDDAYEALALFGEADRLALADQLLEARLWTAVGRARLFDLLGQKDLSRHYAEEAQSHLVSHPDPQVTRWLPLTIGRDKSRAPDVSTASTDAWPGTGPLLRLLKKFALNGYPVILVGESGSGREHVARSLHSICGGRPDGLLLLDGRSLHSSAAYPTPDDLLRRVSSPAPPTEFTLILTDLDGAPHHALQDFAGQLHEWLRAGIRVVITVSPDVLSRDSEMSADLYTLLQAFAFTIPPLRERRRELAALVRSVARSMAGDDDPGLAFTDQAFDVLAGYDWPGNMDELKSVIGRLQQSAAVDPLRVIDADDLSFLRTASRYDGDRSRANGISENGEELSLILEKVERDVIVHALGRAGGHVTAAARALGLSRQGLYKKMKRLEIGSRRSSRTQTSSQ